MNPEELNTSEKSRLCLKCGGACCKVLHIPVPLSLSEDEDVKVFWQTRAVALLRGKDKFVVIVPSICPQLDAKGACRIYASRPEICRTYDARRDVSLKDVCLWKTTKGKAISGI